MEKKLLKCVEHKHRKRRIRPRRLYSSSWKHYHFYRGGATAVYHAGLALS